MNEERIPEILKSESMQILVQKVSDGTFAELLDDWKWILSFSRRYKWIIVLYTLLGFVSSTMALASSYASRTMINIVTGKDTGRIGLVVAIIVGTTVFSIVFSAVIKRVNAHISLYVNNDIQSEIFGKIMDAKWEELNKYQKGDLLNRFNNDVWTVAENAISWIPDIVVTLYTFLVTFFILLRMDPTMAWIAVISAPVVFLLTRYIMRNIKTYRKKVTELDSQMMSFETEVFYNFDTIKSFGIIGHYSRQLKGWQEKYKQCNLDYNKQEIKTDVLMSIVSHVVAWIAFGYCIYRLWTGKILYGDMTFFLDRRAVLSGNFNALIHTIPSMVKSSVSAHRIRELVELEKEVHHPEILERLRELGQKGLSIELDGVDYAYRKDRRADGHGEMQTDGHGGLNQNDRTGDGCEERDPFNNSNHVQEKAASHIREKLVYEKAKFRADPNEIVAVMGESGGGKTTLFRLLLALVSPQEGEVRMYNAGGEAVEMSADLRELISYVPQGNTAVLGTIAENLRMVREDASEEEMIRALQIARAWDFVEPIGLDTPLGERGKGISEGQAQRLAIARAVLRDAPIMLLDEATSALDEKTENEVLDSLVQHCSNKTIIIATHRPSVLSRCNHIYRIENKKIIEKDRQS